MTSIHAEPVICPACGELVIATYDTPCERRLPDHADRIFPALLCSASDRVPHRDQTSQR